jgi:hypothetical protein
MRWQSEAAVVLGSCPAEQCAMTCRVPHLHCGHERLSADLCCSVSNVCVGRGWHSTAVIMTSRTLRTTSGHSRELTQPPTPETADSGKITFPFLSSDFSKPVEGFNRQNGDMTTFAKNCKSTVIPGLRYRNAKTMIDWLGEAFGFEKQVVYPATPVWVCKR